MKKRLMWIIIALFVLSCLCATACAEELTSGLFTYKLKGNGNAVITKFNWSSNENRDVYIPRQIDGYNVSEIGPFAFSSEDLGDDFAPGSVGQSVVIVLPDTITVIGEKAFYCSKITTITIPSSVQVIGPGAFAGCSNISAHNVEAGNPVYTTISGVLYNKQKKELVSFPFGRDNASFSIVPDGIESIGDYAFAGCTILDRDKGNIFPSSVKAIGKYAYYGATLKSDYRFNFNQITKIDSYAFANAVFQWMKGEKHLMLQGDSVTDIGPYAFYNATITFDGVSTGVLKYEYNTPFPFKKIKNIGEYAFSCTRLSCCDYAYEITFPVSLTSIGIGAFDSVYGESYDKLQNLDFSGTSITVIPEYAFSKASLNIKLPEKTTVIKEYAFYRYNGNSVTIPRTVESIGEYAFAEGTGGNLGANTEGSKLESIADYAFYNANTSTALPDGLKSIGTRSLWSSNQKTIYIPASVTEIGEEFCDRSKVSLKVEAGSYGALYASENGYQVIGQEDTSWLND